MSREADASDGLLTLKGFTTAILACCSSKCEKERLFRYLRGEGAWKQWGEEESLDATRRPHDGGAGGDRTSGPCSSAAPNGVPAFVTQLSAYRRQVCLCIAGYNLTTKKVSRNKIPAWSMHSISASFRNACSAVEKFLA